MLLVSDSTGTTLTRWEIDASGDPVRRWQGLTGSVSLGASRRPASSSTRSTQRRLRGTVLGNVFQLAPGSMPGRRSSTSALTGQGRLAPPVTGVDVYLGAQRDLSARRPARQGLTVYNLNTADPRAGAFRVIAQDTLGSITGPTGVAVTNLPAGATVAAGAHRRSATRRSGSSRC